MHYKSWSSFKRGIECEEEIWGDEIAELSGERTSYPLYVLGSSLDYDGLQEESNWLAAVFVKMEIRLMGGKNRAGRTGRKILQVKAMEDPIPY